MSLIRSLSCPHARDRLRDRLPLVLLVAICLGCPPAQAQNTQITRPIRLLVPFGPGLLATVHMAATFERETMVEYTYVELGASPLGDAIALRVGRIAVPTGAGLGCDPDAEIIARHRVD